MVDPPGLPVPFHVVPSQKQVELILKPVQFGEHPPGRANEHRAGSGRVDPSRMTVEEPELKDFLKFLQALGQGRLADADRCRRLAGNGCC